MKLREFILALLVTMLITVLYYQTVAYEDSQMENFKLKIKIRELESKK